MPIDNYVRWFLMSNYYANKHMATASDFRIAVPPDLSSRELFQIAAIAFGMRIEAWRIRHAINYMIGGA
jgi:hypothetical protein